jgi:putative ABC transport system ATP-binding protein
VTDTTDITPPVAAAPIPPPVSEPEVVARANDAVKVYGKGGAAVTALNGISVAFNRQQFTAIMGPSGSGKSTLLHCLAGLDSLTSGQIFIGPTELGTLSEKQLTLLRRERVGFIFQAYNLVPTLSAADNIRLPLAIAGRKADPSTFDEVISTMRLADRLDHRPGELSGGQQQRVAAARALVSKPDIIFADEPTGNLDSVSGVELLGFLRSAVDDGRHTVVMVTHDPGGASRADRVIFLADGRVVREMANPTTDGILEYMKSLGR